MNKAAVYRNWDLAGVLEKTATGYRFTYEQDYWHDPSKPAISLTLPKSQISYESPYLFSFFFNMLSEGANRALQSRALKIDEKDYFGLLLATGSIETIGAVWVVPYSNDKA